MNKTIATVAVVAVGAALFETALLPGLALGVAAVAAPKYLPKPVTIGKGTHEVGIVSLGSCDGAIREALDILARQKIDVDYMRVKSFPFNNDVENFLKSHSTIFVVEQNRDAQLKTLLVNDAGINPASLISLLHYDGTPITARFIAASIRKSLVRRKVAA